MRACHPPPATHRPACPRTARPRRSRCPHCRPPPPPRTPRCLPAPRPARPQGPPPQPPAAARRPAQRAAAPVHALLWRPLVGCVGGKRCGAPVPPSALCGTHAACVGLRNRHAHTAKPRWAGQHLVLARGTRWHLATPIGGAQRMRGPTSRPCATSRSASATAASAARRAPHTAASRALLPSARTSPCTHAHAGALVAPTTAATRAAACPLLCIVHACAHACLHVRLRVRLRVCLCVYACAHACLCVCVHTRARMHAPAPRARPHLPLVHDAAVGVHARHRPARVHAGRERGRPQAEALGAAQQHVPAAGACKAVLTLVVHV